MSLALSACTCMIFGSNCRAPRHGLRLAPLQLRKLPLHRAEIGLESLQVLSEATSAVRTFPDGEHDDACQQHARAASRSACCSGTEAWRG